MRYWFRKREGLRSKDLGWDYAPISLEGILMYIILLALIIATCFIFNLLHAKLWQGIGFIVTIIILIVIFIMIAKPRTRDSLHWTRFHERVYR